MHQPEQDHFETSQAVEALHRLLAAAERDTTASRVAANLILAWWNAKSLRGFDPADTWLLDDAHQRDAISVFTLAARSGCYPDRYVPRRRIMGLIREWRPEILLHAEIPDL